MKKDVLLFCRYRGLDDFRSAQWRNDENLPKEYANISKFSNVRGSKKAALDSTGKTIVVGLPQFNLACCSKAPVMFLRSRTIL